ncbi:hypothetical protein B0H10DRAFT_1332030 [Mycena sp. CBHHK59/15]|nr:hypothetical protein B0H10DRAFT_1332030 [Mycena sp. CBHHK59/15]
MRTRACYAMCSPRTDVVPKTCRSATGCRVGRQGGTAPNAPGRPAVHIDRPRGACALALGDGAAPAIGEETGQSVGRLASLPSFTSLQLVRGAVYPHRPGVCAEDYALRLGIATATVTAGAARWRCGMVGLCAGEDGCCARLWDLSRVSLRTLVKNCLSYKAGKEAMLYALLELPLTPAFKTCSCTTVAAAGLPVQSRVPQPNEAGGYVKRAVRDNYHGADAPCTCTRPSWNLDGLRRSCCWWGMVHWRCGKGGEMLAEGRMDVMVRGGGTFGTPILIDGALSHRSRYMAVFPAAPYVRMMQRGPRRPSLPGVRQRRWE